MRVDAAMLRGLAALGLSADQVAGVVALVEREDEARREAKRAGNRERQIRSRASRSVTRDTPPVTRDPAPPKKGSPEPPPKNNPPTHALDGAGVIDADFASWWASYPDKVGKGAAETAYRKARKAGVTRADLVAGLARYVRCKPPDRPWCNPATWLNQKRWLDEPAPPPTTRPAHASRNQPTGGRHGYDPRTDGPRTGGRFDEAAEDIKRELRGRRDRAAHDPP